MHFVFINRDDTCNGNTCTCTSNATVTSRHKTNFILFTVTTAIVVTAIAVTAIAVTDVALAEQMREVLNAELCQALPVEFELSVEVNDCTSMLDMLGCV